MSGPDDRLEDFLRKAFSAGVPEPEYDADMASPVEVSQELRRRVLEQVRRESGELLARRLLQAAEETGWTREELLHETLGHERETAALLEGWGDPRSLTPAGLARLLWRVELDPIRWRELLTQTVASLVVFARPAEGRIFGRTTGLDDERRAYALAGGDVTRDPLRAWGEASSFVEEVEDQWTTLIMEPTSETDSE